MIEYIFLGILQGLTEFLPVSSSGHLVIAQSLFKNFTQPGILFDVMLHFATFLAVLIYFRKRVKEILKGILGFFIYRYRVTYYDNKRYIWGIFWASVPTGIIGLYFNDKAEILFSSTSIVGYCLIITSLLLYFSDRKNPKSTINVQKSFIAGIVQGISVIPGISRSGSTIASLIYMDVKREEAAEFSFLMALPAVFGATLLQVKELSAVEMDMIVNYLAGMFAAFIFGIIAIYYMLIFVKRASLKVFALYCLILGIVSIIWL
jgi:undecaprenyl-diphosphatase